MHKDEIENIISNQLSEIFPNQDKVQKIALMLSFILEGSIARAGLEGSSHKIQAAKRIVLNILEQEVV